MAIFNRYVTNYQRVTSNRIGISSLDIVDTFFSLSGYCRSLLGTCMLASNLYVESPVKIGLHLGALDKVKGLHQQEIIRHGLNPLSCARIAERKIRNTLRQCCIESRRIDLRHRSAEGTVLISSC